MRLGKGGGIVGGGGDVNGGGGGGGGGRQFQPDVVDEAGEAPAAGAEGGGVLVPDDEDRAGHQDAVEELGGGHERARAAVAEDGEALRLEMNVADLVGEDLVAQPAEHRRAG